MTRVKSATRRFMYAQQKTQAGDTSSLVKKPFMIATATFVQVAEPAAVPEDVLRAPQIQL